MPLEMKGLRLLDDMDFTLFILRRTVELDPGIDGLSQANVIGDVAHLTDLVAAVRAELRAAS